LGAQGEFYIGLAFLERADQPLSSALGVIVPYRVRIGEPQGFIQDPEGVVFFTKPLTFAGAAACQPTVTITIDIKPDSEQNTINLNSAGVIPVALLSSATFDAATVNPNTISLAGARVKLVGKSEAALCHLEDSNDDSLPDLVCQVLTADFMIEQGESVAVLEAETFDGILVRGQDSVRIVPE
jgi:hypothetical protein